MKTTRLLIFFLLALVITTAGLSFIMATNQKVERSIVINASASSIYNQLIKLENFNKISVWSQEDSTVIYKNEGTDGTIGASISWKGSPEISGEGKIEITGLDQNKKVVHQIYFSKPKKGIAESIFILSESEKAVTTVTWIFKLATPRPWNIFNLMYSLDEKMGNDFEEGLSNLKTFIESNVIMNALPAINK